MNREEYLRMFEAEERQWWYAGMRAIALALLAGKLSPDPVRRVLDAGSVGLDGRMSSGGRARYRH